ncbi:hypothetical protein QL285_066416 [Trifolium repens]|nr:hypothetical protein QL285_066416 [Trifolium repens]
MKTFWDHQRYSKVAVVEAQGQAGGIWILQQEGNNLSVQVEDIYVNAITFSIAIGSNKWFCSGIYASPTPSLRNQCWDHLCDVHSRYEGPWVIIGDFNEIISPREQRGGNFYQHRADGLITMMDNCNLVDLSSVGGKFTWHRNCRGQRSISKKLDRGMANLNWRVNFPEAFIETLCRNNSDHNPIFLRCGGLPIARGARPFRFEAAWINHSDYEDVVLNAWLAERGNITSALNKVKDDSIVFNKDIFGNIFRKKREIANRLKGIQNTLERVDSVRLVLLEKQLQEELDQILFQEEVLWYQKSREKWIKFGDKNTKFFHAQTVIRRKRNKIHGLNLPCGAWCTEDSILQEEANKFFKNLFCSTSLPHDTDFDVSDIPQLSGEEVSDLTKQVTKEEVLRALNQMHPFKSPGPDGFQGVFFRQYWHIIGDDIYTLINQAFNTGSFDSSLAETLLVLIPKVDCPKNFREFRPISLCNTVYKLITKVLVNRLRPMLDSIIGPFQSSFLPGRGTCDNAIVLQEIIHSMHKSKKKKGDVAYKIDLEKAYDNVNWSYLKNCLLDFGFPAITIKLIMHCVTSSSLSLIWNGKRQPNFSPTRGLRQGDPLSPYLFVICMEKLSLAISESVRNNNWKPVQVSKNGPCFSHLFFADDVLLFSKATCTQGRLMADIFNKFSNVSGLKISCSKSRALFSNGVSRRKIRKITSLSSIRSTNSLNNYLGFPMLSGRVKKEDFNFILDKVNARLASWKNRLLNKPGRLALATSVLNSIPTYYMQISWLPAGICSQIDKMTRKFIWQGTSNKGIHLVGWHHITKAKKDGGLGVRTTRDANTSMLGKLVWDIQQGANKPWVKMIQDKYLQAKPFLTSTKTYGSHVWNSIYKAKEVLKDGYRFKIGDGNSLFWYSPWLYNDPLCKFVDFVAIQDTQTRIKDIFFDDSWHLNHLYSQIPDYIMHAIKEVAFILNDAIPDCFIWKENMDGIYTASSGYKWLLEKRNHDSNISWRWIWKLKAPENIKFFIWCACHKAIPTLALLNNRNMAASNLCVRCQNNEETIIHCIRDCTFAKNLWINLGFSDISFFSNSDLVNWLKTNATGAAACSFLAGLWWSWKARNMVCVGNESIHLFQVVSEARRLSALLSILHPPALARHEAIRLVSWHPSRENCFVLNVDGSCNTISGRAGTGGLIRRGDGSWVIGFSSFLGMSNNTYAEIMAIYQGLRLAKDSGCLFVICYSDSKGVIDLITKPLNKHHCYASILANILDLLNMDWDVRICHTLREGNASADFLAKWGASNDINWKLWNSPPEDLKPTLRNDLMRTPVPRV